MREWGAMARKPRGRPGDRLRRRQHERAPMIAATADGLTARGPLAAALETQLAADQGGAVRIG